jgi:hypothetical protein
MLITLRLETAVTARTVLVARLQSIDEPSDAIRFSITELAERAARRGAR